ncbi:MAG: hypothetical protein JRM88_06520 [Nitrososphaerota archaeon]|nr:hypothetical protein [Nitrososphaerota archaeon]
MKVTLGTLKGKGDELATFLEPRVGVKPSVSGDSMEIEDESVREGVKPRQVKTYIKRFLFMNGVRKKYRVFVSGKELTIQEVVLGEEPEEEKEEKEKKAPAKEPEQAEEETAKAPEEPEPEDEGTKAGEPEKEEEPEEKPKKAAPKKPRARKKKAEEP